MFNRHIPIHQVRSEMNNFFMYLPCSTKIKIEHKSVYALEYILKNFLKTWKAASPARCMIVLPKLEKKQEENIRNLVKEMKGLNFMQLPKNNFFLRLHSERDVKLSQLGNQDDLNFYLFENQGAQIAHPIISARLEVRLANWNTEQGIQNCKFNFPISINLNWSNNIRPSLNNHVFPIATYDHKYPLLPQLLHYLSKDKAFWIDKLNNEIEKSYFFAGFFPKTFCNFIKKLRPMSYKEDLHNLRFDLLESNCRVWEHYVKINNWTYKLTKTTKSSEHHNHELSGGKKVKLGIKRKHTNIHGAHQDRKKKRKHS